MQILYLSTWFPYPPDNGSKQRVFYLLRSLAAKHSVSVCAFAFGTAKPGEHAGLDFCQKVYSVAADPFERSRVSRGLRFLSTVPMVERPVSDMARLVGQVCRENTFDAIVASTTAMACYVPRERTAGTVLEEHNFPTLVNWERHQAQKLPLQRLRTWLSFQKRRHYDSRVFSRFSLVTVVSEQDRAAALQMLVRQPPQIEVVANGVDTATKRPGLAEPQPWKLIYSGALTYAANYDAVRHFLYHIFPLIRQKFPWTTLTVTGSTVGVDLTRLPHTDNLLFSGYVDDIRPLVAGAAVCVVPLVRGGGSRLKILEAMALGTPVVSTSKGAQGLDVVDGEHLRVADDPVVFAEAVMSLMTDSELRRRLTANARRLVEQQYDWDTISSSFVSLVEETARCGSKFALAGGQSA